ncbi:hypothetical protein ST47_g10465 [Ascochyta rabiei]|uniref:Uncharacterized protein n=1 Tax=Didymella rabiei TaxID=5454 RepID=A0A162VBR9_DIDRA|nr:hypothetical protein ST47_g10465 [Ascochyta rabiei]
MSGCQDVRIAGCQDVRIAGCQDRKTAAFQRSAPKPSPAQPSPVQSSPGLLFSQPHVSLATLPSIDTATRCDARGLPAAAVYALDDYSRRAA